MPRNWLSAPVVFISLLLFIVVGGSQDTLARSMGSGASTQGTTSDSDFDDASDAGSSLEVLYVTQAGTITTYNVDRNSGTAREAGTPFNLPGGLLIQQITPSPNGHFLYILWTDTAFNPHFSVYATHASGAPKGSPVQTLAGINWQFVLHPSGKFAYVLRTYSNQSGTSSVLKLYHVNTRTGKLILPSQKLLHFGPDSSHYESLNGISKDGKRLYDVWNFNVGSQNNATYSYQLIDQDDGTLYHNTTLLTTSNVSGVDVVKITTKFVFDLHNDGAIQQDEVLKVYSNVPNATTPRFVCTSRMLDACQNSFDLFVDPREKYLFLPDSATQQLVVAKVEKATNQLVQTDSVAGNPAIASVVFSPDALLVYAFGFRNGNSYLDIYTFNKRAGELSFRQELAPSAPYWIYTAVRK